MDVLSTFSHSEAMPRMALPLYTVLFSNTRLNYSVASYCIYIWLIYILFDGRAESEECEQL